MNGMKQCAICGDYLLDDVDICDECKRCYDQVMTMPIEPPKPPTCDYCGKPAHERYAVWINGGMVEKWFCSAEHASYKEMGAEG